MTVQWFVMTAYLHKVMLTGALNLGAPDVAVHDVAGAIKEIRHVAALELRGVHCKKLKTHYSDKHRVGIKNPRKVLFNGVLYKSQ
jgi:hypothetical protein